MNMYVTYEFICFLTPRNMYENVCYISNYSIICFLKMNVRPKKVDPWLGFEKGAPAPNYSIGKENLEQSFKVIPCSSMLD